MGQEEKTGKGFNRPLSPTADQRQTSSFNL